MAQPFMQMPMQPLPTQVMPQGVMPGNSYDTALLPPAPGMQGAPPQNIVTGVPGAQVAQPYYPGQMAAQQWQAQLQSTAQQPLMPQGWQQPQPQQQQGWPPQQQYQPTQYQQPQQPQTAQLHDGVVLDGPGVPPELRGRTWGDARRLYQALSTDWLQRNQRPATPAGQSLQQQGYPQPVPQVQPQQPWPQQPQQFPGQAPQGQQQTPFMQQLTAAVQQVVGQELAPMRQQSQMQAIAQARAIAATGTPDFQQLEPDIMQMVAGAPPETLQRPETWQLAARAARGLAIEQGRYQMPGQRLPGQQRQPAPGPGAWVPAQAQAPAAYGFSEAPSAPSINGQFGGMGPRQATQEDQMYAQRWGMPLDQFMSWKYGAGQSGSTFSPNGGY